MASPKTAARTPRSNRRRKGRPQTGAQPGIGGYDFALLGIVAILVGLGLVMIFSASYAHAREYYDQATYFFLNQLRWLSLGLIVMVVAALVDYRVWQSLAVITMAVTLVLLIAVLIVGEENLGARRHLLGGSLQPSEFAKLTITFYVAYWLTSKGEQLKDVTYGLLPFAVLMGLVAGLLLLEPDIGTTVLLVMTSFAMFFIAGADTRQLLISFAVSVATLFLIITRIEYASDRVDQFLIAIKDPLAAGFHVGKLAEAIAAGGLVGNGLGDGTSKLPGGLPLPWSDSIFAVVGEELGLVGTLAVVALFMALAYRGLRIALETRDPFGMVLACGITAWISIQAFVNMAVNTATLPFSGMPLPFISYGGSSLVVTLASIGALLSISRYGNVKLPARARAATPELAALGLRGRDWWARLSDPGRARRPARSAGKRTTSARSRSAATRRGHAAGAKAVTARRPRGLKRQVARTRRSIARRTQRRQPAGSRRVPRRR